tara:strand:- start:151 stop:954 length:804 start_codon:yes stop_codon:yes gene_type:complete
MNRKAIACPEYYPNTFDKLDKEIQSAFNHKKGPGSVQSSRRDTKVDSIIVPCNQIEKCGSCSAWGYIEIAESNFPEAYIILGTNNHSNTKFSTYLFTNWETPFGITKVHVDLGRELMNIFPQLLNEHTAHEEEHSVEVQIPWLQFSSRDKLTDLRFIPVSIGTESIKDIKKFAEALFKFSQQHNITIIASSNIEDTATIKYIESLDTEALINYRKRKEKSIKEVSPILTLMELANIKEQQAKVINYQPSTAGSKEERLKYHACIKFK